jgi:hypothetical protein
MQTIEQRLQESLLRPGARSVKFRSSRLEVSQA